MDRERLERFREGYLRTNEAFKRHDWTIFAALPEDFEWHPFENVIDEDVVRGPRGVQAFFERMVEVYPDWWAEARDFVPAPGDKIVVLCVGRGTARTSGIPSEPEFAQVWEFDGVTPRRVREYPSHAEGLRAAGVEPG